MKTISYPNLTEIIEPILKIKATIDSKVQAIEEWKNEYLKQLKVNRGKDRIQIFNIFSSALLERQMRGEAYDRRIQLNDERIKNYEDVTSEKVKEILKETGYRWLDKGTEVVLELKKLTENNFVWEDYFKEAERKYLTNFVDDPFLKIKYVGTTGSFKVRDFALSEFSPYYLANDLHIVKLIKRTGLLLEGYGDPDFGTNQQDPKEYLFLKRLVIKLSEESGWGTGKGYSPGEIDKIFWHFGRSVCKAKPECRECPIGNTCLTGKMGYENGKR